MADCPAQSATLESRTTLACSRSRQRLTASELGQQRTARNLTGWSTSHARVLYTQAAGAGPITQRLIN